VLDRNRACLSKEGVVAVTKDEAAYLMQQPGARLTFDPWPQLVRSANQRDVLRAFADRQTRDPCLPMGRAMGVWRGEAVKRRYPEPSLSQPQRHCAPHRAEADDDHVGPGRH
jgi:hypothetical protein